MLCQPLIREGVIGVQQFDDVSILLHHATEEQLDFFLEGGAQVVVEIGEQVDDGFLGVHRANVQPLAREVLDESLGARIGQHAANLSFQRRGFAQAVLSRQIDEFIVRDAAPQEERKP